MSTHRPPDDDRLDAWLASSKPPAPPAQLREAILRSAQTACLPSRLSWTQALRALWAEIGGLRVAAPVMALALALGLGTSNQIWQAGDQATTEEDDLLSLALIDEDYGSLLIAGTQP